MFAAILKLFGCSGRPAKSDSATKVGTLNEQISKSSEDFKNRPFHKKLTEYIIDTTSDDDLLQTVFDNLIDKFPKNHNENYQTVLSWTKSQQAIYIIWCLEAEINNGGYNQFYFNPSGQYGDLTPDALKLVGAAKFADLAERANEVYKKENEKITKHQDGSLEGFSKSYDDNPLNKFDDEFYELYRKENLQQLQVDFTKKHKQDFIDK
ncbi:MAG: DUF4375 domain-containing protein [Chitinophagaceae bacterium]